MARRLSTAEWKPSDGIVLEPAAEEVALSTENRSVIAGPGAGKTELLAQRALFLLQTGQCRPPQRILAISFKRDAAKTLKERISRRCSSDQADRFDSYTFDAFSKSLVDRFLPLIPEWCRPPSDYRIVFPSRDDWTDFIERLRPPAAIGTMSEVRALRGDDIDRWGPLPLDGPEPDDILGWAGSMWWKENLQSSQPSVTFAMIGRLAEAILAHNPNVLKALRLTYSHIFLDEFQDTTKAQYSLVKQAFYGSRAVLTAVGDTKQRIMTWAGAEAKIFDWFEERFDAKRVRLRMNHRSNARIVQIINDLVKAIEPDAVETLCARADDPVPDDAAGFLIFETDEAEAETLAELVSSEVSSGERRPDEFVLLVRVRANQFETQLRDEFAKRELRLRNEARTIQGIAIQELMADDLVTLVLGLIRLAVGARSQEIFLEVQEALGAITGVDYENPTDLKRLDDLIRALVAIVKDASKDAPSATDVPALLRSMLDCIGVTRVRRYFTQYENVAYFASLQKALAALFGEYAEEVAGWSDWLDAVEGRGQVRLMTIHKSKGLECHTVIFVGLHQNAFWGYRSNKAEETNAFFVALSRARERVYFTRSKESGDVDQIKGLVNLLQNANVPFYEV